MFKKIFLILILFSITVNAQDTLTVKMKPIKSYSYIILNQLNNVNKKYLSNASVKDGEFKMAIPKGTKPGMLRIEYDVNKGMYLDVLYNNEDIDVEFHPDYPQSLVKFKKSKDNILFQKFIDEAAVVQNKLDSVQVVYFQSKDKADDAKLNKLYKSGLATLKSINNKYITASKGEMVSHFINANKRHYNATLIKDTNEFLTNLKSHYYDHIDFNNNVLARSSLFIDRVMDYILYLTNSKDHDELIKLRKEAVTTSLNKISSSVVKNEVMQSVIYMFAKNENKALTDYIFNTHFTKLPIALQDYEFKNTINDMFKTTIGQQAPSISWDVYGKPFSLATMPKSEYYVIVFWGSTCPHCMQELPKYNSFLANHKNIKTIAIGVENDESKSAWKEETFNLENMTHILALGKNGNKWNNKYVKDYGITGTPSYFVLDSNKKIIAKPYDYKKLKSFFEGR